MKIPAAGHFCQLLVLSVFFHFNDAEHLCVCLLDTLCIYFGEMSAQRSVHFLNWVFCLTEFLDSFLFYGYKSFVGYVHHRSFSPACRVSFHYLNGGF